MKIIISLITILVLAGCAQRATVKEIQAQRPGFSTHVKDPLAALEQSISAAENAWRILNRNPADVRALGDYNFAVSRICSTLRKTGLKPWVQPLHIGGRTLAWKRDPRPEWNPARYEFIPTDELKISGKNVDVRDIKAGLGAPLVAKRIGDQVHDHAPTAHFYYAATAIARFQGSRCEITIEDPLEHETTRVGTHAFPLAADFTAPLTMMLVEMHHEKLGLPRLLHPAKFASTTRIARLEPYDPDKTVVLLVHGLMSSPETWFPLLNHLSADPVIRENYQFWFFSYPSGYPYPYSASILRHELDEAEKHYPLRHPMVVVGHSMGGCVSRLLVTDTKQIIWDKMFDVPPEEMAITPEHKHIITESTIFSSRPEIGRVIFISSPHRGSDLALNPLTRWLNKLVQLPTTLISTGLDEARYKKHATGAKHLDRYPDSVDTLAPDNDFVRALNTVPINPKIPYHTIVGDRGKGNSPKSSDGVVPYWSSHQNGAKSEKIVPSGHGSHENPEGIEEARRILHLHLKKAP